MFHARESRLWGNTRVGLKAPSVVIEKAEAVRHLEMLVAFNEPQQQRQFPGVDVHNPHFVGDKSRASYAHLKITPLRPVGTDLRAQAFAFSHAGRLLPRKSQWHHLIR